MEQAPFFWLHVKKSAGMATRGMLSPYYVEVDRSKRPGTFIQAEPAEYNDILNNFRVVLGDYQFKRCQFAQRYLYPDAWDGLYSFAFSREPMSRCISMFHYIFAKRPGATGHALNVMRMAEMTRSVHLTQRSAFDYFLTAIEKSRASDSNSEPRGLHFSTHTATMWDDVTDQDGRVMLTHIFRVESIVPALNQVFADCGLDKRLEKAGPRMNESKRPVLYEPTPQQRRRVEALYRHDYELYEGALRL